MRKIDVVVCVVACFCGINLSTYGYSSGFSRDNGALRSPDTSLKKITVLETNNLVYSDRYTTVYLPKSPTEPEMRKLREYVKSRCILTKSSDLQLFLELMEWVSLSWTHDASHAAPSRATSREILELGRAGQRFRCQEYAQVYHDILTSFGYVSRVLQLRKVGAAYSGLGAGHVAVEVYSNLLRKWVFMDPQMCCYLTKSDNRPLSFYELYQSWNKGEFSGIMVNTSPKITAREKFTDMNEFASTYKTFLQQYFGYQGITSVQSGERVELRLKLDGKLNYLTFQGVPISHRAFTDDPDHLYFDLNKTIILFDYNRSIGWDDVFKRYDILSAEDYIENMSKFAARPDFELTFRNSMPWFDFYEVQIDNGPWTKSKSSSFHWSLKSGDNMIRVRSVNSVGVQGPETFARIRYAPDSSPDG